ncbi:hypothetical protein [Rhodococcus pyridinivorans]|uniref:Uncharacterized protein n=1 Tax=Rhodococcus pyridinivorans TaxID=103816 RepID=A0A7M2XNV6_9NOCA|nr:hypothetical protein [Rhodococcus pyridinivorans]QOV99504.1 hypothetical protein INP59_03630 [Rhodococcus pyridinivorans]
MARYWRGECTLRQLRVLIEHLPPGSARHRQATEGHEWRNNEALLWQILHFLQVLDQRIVWSRGKRPKWPKFKEFPWKRDAVKIGNRGEASSEDVLAYLQSISANRGKDQ